MGERRAGRRKARRGEWRRRRGKGRKKVMYEVVEVAPNVISKQSAPMHPVWSNSKSGFVVGYGTQNFVASRRCFRHGASVASSLTNRRLSDNVACSRRFVWGARISSAVMLLVVVFHFCAVNVVSHSRCCCQRCRKLALWSHLRWSDNDDATACSVAVSFVCLCIARRRHCWLAGAQLTLPSLLADAAPRAADERWGNLYSHWRSVEWRREDETSVHPPGRPDGRFAQPYGAVRPATVHASTERRFEQNQLIATVSRGTRFARPLRQQPSRNDVITSPESE